jgi:hypothetical protein
MLFANTVCTGQNWVQVGDFNKPSSNFTYYDTVKNLMLITSQSRFNGPDTLDGFFSFDGTTFKSLARGRFDCEVDCSPALFLTRYKGDIYLSGTNLDKIDTVEVNGIGRWDGEKWSAGLSGLYLEDSDPYLDGYCIHDGKLYVSGSFRTADGDTCNSVAYWDGQHWTGLNFPGYGFFGSTPRVNHVFFYKDELYAAGNFYVYLDGAWIQDIARYDGAEWHAVGGGLKGGEANIWDYAIYKDELYVCGYFRKLDGNAGNKIMRWDGVQWKDVGGGVCNPFHVTHSLTVYHDKLLLSGIFDCVGDGIPASSIASWDGERWCSFGNSVFYNSINAMFEYKGEFYVSGGFTEVDGQPLKYFAKWVGDHSTDVCSDPVVSSPTPPGTSTSLQLSPNPVGDVLQLAAGENVASVQVWDVYGRVLEGLKPVLQGAGVVLDVSRLPAGWYVLGLRTDSGWRSAKFVKN